MKFNGVFFLVLLNILVGASGALSQDHNEIGLYHDPEDLTTTSIHLTSSGALFLYLVLTNPYLEDPNIAEYAGPVYFVSGFEGRIGVPAGDILFGFTGVCSSINILQLPDMCLGFATPVPVTDQQVLLGHFTLITQAQEPSYYYLSPVSNGQSISGQMAYAAYAAPDIEFLSPMYPISGGFDEPVFAVNGTVVPVESETWGGVKALYR